MAGDQVAGAWRPRPAPQHPDACSCGLMHPGPEHRAHFPLLCAERPAPRGWAEAERAEYTAGAIGALLAAAARRYVTVQWVPEGEGCRFEVVHQTGGGYDLAVHVCPAGHLHVDSIAGPTPCPWCEP